MSILKKDDFKEIDLKKETITCNRIGKFTLKIEVDYYGDVLPLQELNNFKDYLEARIKPRKVIFYEIKHEDPLEMKMGLSYQSERKES